MTSELILIIIYLSESYGMQRMYAGLRRSKVEGEHLKDTALAAVLISWFTAQVIYGGVEIAAAPLVGWTCRVKLQ